MVNRLMGVFALGCWLAGAGWWPAAVASAAGGAEAGPQRELKVWVLYRDRGMEAALDRFEREHPGWRVVTSMAGNAGGMDPQKLLCGIVGGSPPDVVYQDRFAVGEWAARDAFRPLDDWIDASMAVEALAGRVGEALASGETERARAALMELTAVLGGRSPSRALEVARGVLEGMSGGVSPDRLLADAGELSVLLQGVHPDAFYEACWEEACYDNGSGRRVYAIPNTTDDRALYYNKDLLERAGLVDASGQARPPANWQELREYAVRLTEHDASGRITRLGFAPNYGNSWLYLYGWLNGGRFMSADGRTCTLASPRIAEALEYMVDVYDALGGVERVSAYQSTFQSAQFDPFLTGQVAMKIDGDWFQHTIVDFAPGLRFGVVAPPAPAGKESVTWSGGFSWAIPVGAAHPEMGFELIRYLNTDRSWHHRREVAAQYNASRGRSFIPPLAPLPHINQWAYERYVAGDPDMPERVQEHFQTFMDLMEVSLFRPVTPVGQLLWDEHMRAYERAVRHEVSPKAALEYGERQVQAQLDLLFEPRPDRPVPWSIPIGLTAVVIAAGAAVLGVGCRRRRRRAGMMAGREARAGLMFASPWLFGLSVLTIGPIVTSLVLSFCRYDGLHPAQWVGLDNYRRLLTADPLFWKSLANTGFMLLAVPLGMVVGLGIALLLNTGVRGLRVYRTLFYLPTLVPVVASSILWIWVLNPEMGLVNAMLRLLGWSSPPGWLQSEDWLLGAKSAIILMLLWGAGGSMIIWLAGLKGVPRQLYEAAEIDGAGPGRRFVHVTLPMLSPYVLFNLVIGVIGMMQIFSQAYIMTSGGPNDSTLFYAYYLFNHAFRYFNMGYASALAWILFLIIMALTLVQMSLANRWVHYEG